MTAGLPVISLEIQGMNAGVKKVILEHLTDLSSEVQHALDRVCAPENVQRVIDRHVGSALDEAVREEVERFYRSGPGRAKIREAVDQKLGSLE